jgi:hypothetical protein
MEITHKENIRIINEIRKLSSEIYKEIIYNKDELCLTFIRISDNESIKIIFPKTYPFGIPAIYINNRIIPVNDWIPTKKFTDYLNFDKKVLIVAHAFGVFGTFEPLTLKNHWYGSSEMDYFKKLFLDYSLKGNPVFETIDIKPGGTYQQDAFSDKFIESHINNYDLVMVPDCGGIWYELQNSHTGKLFLTEEEINDNKEKLIEICLNFTKIVKPGGIIQFSKFLSEIPCVIYSENFNTFSDALSYHLKLNGFEVKIKILDNTIFLIGQKIIY